MLSERRKPFSTTQDMCMTVLFRCCFLLVMEGSHQKDAIYDPKVRHAGGAYGELAPLMPAKL